MFRVTRRRLLVSYLMLIMIWAAVIIVIHIVIGGWSPLWLFVGHIRKLDSAQLKRLMSSLVLNEDNVTLFANPLLQLLAPDDNFFHFFGLPKRKSHLIYGEVISSHLLFVINRAILHFSTFYSTAVVGRLGFRVGVSYFRLSPNKREWLSPRY